MDKNFYKYADLIIKNYEGGYFHPDMYKRDPVKYKVMHQSGETMFGIDRTAGGNINNTPQGKQFWALIDAQNASTNWSYNYKPKAGSDLDKKLRKLCAEMMYDVYERYALKNLSEKAKKLVAKSPKIQAHLYYGCWNGVGYVTGFSGVKGFVPILNEAVAKGTTNITKLEEIALNSRKNHEYSFMRDRAKNMLNIWKQLPDAGSLAWLWWTLGIVTVAGLGVLAYTQDWHKTVIYKFKELK
mgnify:CR=1 FL=1